MFTFLSKDACIMGQTNTISLVELQLLSSEEAAVTQWGGESYELLACQPH